MKQVGDVLVRDHTSLDAKGATLAKSKNITLPKEPSADQQKSLTALKPKNGTKAYDTAWLKVQSTGHQQALKLIDEELKSGKDVQIKAAAKDGAADRGRAPEDGRGRRLPLHDPKRLALAVT